MFIIVSYKDREELVSINTDQVILAMQRSARKGQPGEAIGKVYTSFLLTRPLNTTTANVFDSLLPWSDWLQINKGL